MARPDVSPIAPDDGAPDEREPGGARPARSRSAATGPAPLPTIPPAWAQLAATTLEPPGVGAAQDAPVVLGLHGLVSSGRTMRHALAPLAASGMRVWLPDALGHGASPMPEDARYDIPTHLAALSAWADATAGPGPYWLVGCSMGSLIALAWAARQPERVRGVVLTSAPIFADTRAARAFLTQNPLAAWILQTPWMAEAACHTLCGAQGPGRRISEAQALRGVFGWGALQMYGLRSLLPGAPTSPDADPLELARAGLVEAFEDCWLHSWRSLYNSLRYGVVGHNAWADIAQVRANGTPACFLHGDKDDLAPLAGARAAATYGGWSLHKYPRATHALTISHSRVVGAEIARFVAKADAERLRQPQADANHSDRSAR